MNKVVLLCSAFASVHILCGVIALSAETYGVYVSADTGIVKSPEGFASNDDCWRTSWFHASLVVISSKDPALYESLKQNHAVDLSSVTTFLKYFRENCLKERSLLRAGSLTDDFSRDQLVPLLYLIEAVRVCGPDDARPHAKAILEHVVGLVKSHGRVSPTAGGAVGKNLSYCIDVIGDKHGVSLLNSFERGLSKVEFSLALKFYNAQAQVPIEDIKTLDDFSVFNSLGLVSQQCLSWGKDDDDVEAWRSNFKLLADKGWGPSFRLVSGRSITEEEIDKYGSAHITRLQDNDIIMAQRPTKYLKHEYPEMQFSQGSGEDRHLVLDYVILKGLQCVWK